MTHELWTEVDQYISDHIAADDDVLDAAVRDSRAAGLPQIQVSAPQGKMLQILARGVGAKNILEIGTLGAYSTIWLARAVARGGHVVTLEVNATHAKVAEANVARAGLSDVVDIRLGRALESLPKLTGPFDFFFIDADKVNIPQYVDWSIRLARPGSLIVVDNVVREGGLINPNSGDEAIEGVRRMHEMLAGDARVSATTIQTVGSKKYDGFTLAIVN